MAEFNKDEKERLERGLADGTFHNPAEDERFTDMGVAWIISNPIYTGIDPYPPTVDEDIWISAFTAHCERVGLELSLKAMLTALRQTYKGTTGPDGEPVTLAR